ncbi:MAG: radical SAM family heme chaperone HemW [Planctomycetota bacterium]
MPLPVLEQVDSVLRRDEIAPAVATSLYVHVPFCTHKCHYCDFYSITRQTDDRMMQFVRRTLRELDGWLASDVRVEPTTIYFGGGTPSLLPLDAMTRLLDGIAERTDLSRVEEFTVEVNPATADARYLAAMRQRGVGRISIGAQSFDDRELAVLERHHDPADVGKAVRLARDAGIDRQSIDLIFAVPGQTLDDWQRTLDAGLAIGTEHLSCYGLTYEPNTPLTVRRRLGRVTAVEESVEVQMFRHTRDVCAAAGRPSYEISNYAEPGRESRHNLAYWAGDNYLGLGPSAASHVGGLRFPAIRTSASGNGRSTKADSRRSTSSDFRPPRVAAN